MLYQRIADAFLEQYSSSNPVDVDYVLTALLTDIGMIEDFEKKEFEKTMSRGRKIAEGQQILSSKRRHPTLVNGTCTIITPTYPLNREAIVRRPQRPEGAEASESLSVIHGYDQ